MNTIRTPLQTFSAHRHRDAWLLGFMVVAIMALDLIWISRDSGRMYVDYARHLGDSIAYVDTFGWSDPLRPLTAFELYPPFMYFVTNLFYWVLGTTDLWVAILSNVVFLAILVYATYAIGKTLWSPRVGLLAALFVATSPLFATMFRQYMLDAPLAAMTALALYLLIRSEDFASRRFSLFLGVVSGLALLTKWSFVMCLGLPVAYSVVVAVAHAVRRRSGERIVNMALAGLLTFAVAGTWYVHNWSKLRADADRFAPFQAPGHPDVGTLASTLWYFWNLLNNQLYAIPFLFFATGVIYVFRRDESARKNLLPVLTIVGTYLPLAMIANKDYRYTMPMLPAVAIVAIHWLEYVGPKLRNWLSGGLVAYCALAFFVISFGTSLLPEKIAIELKARPYTSSIQEYVPPESPTVTGIVLFAQHGFLVGKPSKQRWYQEDLFDEIASRGGTSFAYVGEPLETIWFNTWGLRYYGLKNDLVWLEPDAAEFVIVRGAAQPPASSDFGLVKEYQLPYSGPVRLYQRLGTA